MKKQKNKLVLGTVQLGMKYGLNNTHGQPTTDEAFSILDAALAGGIDTFDTAYAYGTAEEVLGAWIKDRALAGKIKVISKMKPHAMNDYPDGTKAVDVVRRELEKSLQRLNLKTLDGYLFHSPHYIYMKHMVEGMQKIKEEGLVSNIGVSVYDEPEALQAAELGVDYVQVPYNAFDQRLDKTDFFKLAKKNKVTVFARSPFLQGLLLMRPNKLPAHLSSLRSQQERFVEIAARHGHSLAETALRFVYAARPTDRIVVGIETLAQLEENMEVTSSPLDRALVADLREAFMHLNRGAINPSLWSKIKL